MNFFSSLNSFLLFVVDSLGSGFFPLLYLMESLVINFNFFKLLFVEINSPFLLIMLFASIHLSIPLFIARDFLMCFPNKGINKQQKKKNKKSQHQNKYHLIFPAIFFITFLHGNMFDILKFIEDIFHQFLLIFS